MSRFDCGECPNVTSGCSDRCMKSPESPGVTFLSRTELNKRFALEHAMELVKEAGYDLVPRPTLGCEGPAK
jgi:hypothetical protein